MAEEDKLSSRVTVVEVSLQTLTKDLQNLANIVRESHETLNASINKVSEKLSEAKNTRWDVVFSGVGIIALCIGALMSVILMNSNSINEKIIRNNEQIQIITNRQFQNERELGKIDAKLENK